MFTEYNADKMVETREGNFIVYLTDAEEGLRPLRFTEGVAGLLGYTADEFEVYLQTHTLSEMWGFDQDLLWGHINQHLIIGENTSHVCQLVHKTDGYFWFYTRSQIVGELDGETVIETEFINVDNVANIAGMLANETHRCIYIVDQQNYKLLYVNKTFEKWSGKAKKDLLGGFCYEKCKNCSENTGKPCKTCFPVETIKNGGKMELQGKDGKTFFSLECSKANWAGHPAYAIIITDVTEQKTAEMDRLERHYNRINVPITSETKLYASYFVNLTNDTVQQTKNHTIIENEQQSYEAVLGMLLSRVASLEERRKLSETFNAENLMQCFRNGQLSLRENAYFMLDEENEAYMRFHIYMSKNPSSKNIEGVFYLEDITTIFLLNRIAEFVMNSAYERLAIIDTKHSTFTPLEKKESGVHALGETVDYESELLSQATRNIMENEQKMFLYRGSISNLEKQLAEKKQYSIMVHTKSEDGKLKYSRFTYHYMSKKKGIILCSFEDITEDYEIDSLTGLFNYEGFAVRAADLIKNPEKEYAALYFNIKGFKAINELFGNKAGDEVLKEVTRQLKKSSMNPKLLGRIAVTDHFLAIVEKQDLDYEEIKRMCHLHLDVDDREISIHGRCGITFIQDTETAIDRVCDQAKLAKQHITDEYVQPYAVFDEKMREAYLSKSNAASVACQALDNNEFCVYYQPIFDAKTGKIASAEALVRWIRPGVGMISPGLFIPALEENGYISLVDRFVARNVRQFQQARLAKGKKYVPVSINLSWIDFYDESMMNSVMEDIEAMNEHVKALRYEVTETSWAAMNDRSNKILRTFKEKGIKILLDDFGSGFSSFSTVRDYDFDILKIDMGFVQKLGFNAKADGIVCAIIDMAHHIQAKVVAEGVETEEQRKFLTENGCDYLQGYYFSKPIPEEEFEKLLNQEEA